MYPYRCEACGVRFYRRVRVGKEGIVPPRRSETHPAPSSGPVKRPAAVPAGPKTLTHPELPGEKLSHEEFVELIDQMRQTEKRRDPKTLPGHDEKS